MDGLKLGMGMVLVFTVACSSDDEGARGSQRSTGTAVGAAAGAQGGAGGLAQAGSGGGASNNMAGGGDGDGDGLNEDDICGSLTIDAEVTVVDQPGNLLVVFDRSNSMEADFDTPSGPQPRYLAAGEALMNALAPLADQLTVGAVLFPSVEGTLFCTAQVDAITSTENINFLPGADFISAWGAYWQSHDLNLGTWINRAFERAEEAISTSTLTGATAVVLFSDGEPICQDGVPADQQAAAWAAQGIPTYVVGLPGAAGSPYLTAIANSGGQGAFLTPADSLALEAELATIAQSTVRTGLDSCAIQLDTPPEDPDKVHMVVEDVNNGQQFDVPRERGPGDGWALAADGLSIQLTGALCDEATQGRFSNVTFQFGCVDLPILVD